MTNFMKKAIAFIVAFALVLTSGIIPNVKASAAKAPKLNKKSATLEVGSTVKLKVKNAPSKAKIKWSTSKKKVATVNKKGKVTAVAEGKAKINAKVTYKKKGKKVTKKLKCKVTVTAATATTTAPVAVTTAAAVSKAPAKTVAPVVTKAPASAVPASAVPASAEPTSEPTTPAETVAPETEEPVQTDAPESEYTIPPDATPYVAPETADFVYDDTTNIAESPTILIRPTLDFDGNEVVDDEGKPVQTVIEQYDNGVMRKDLDSQKLILTEMGNGINLGNTLEATFASYNAKTKAKEATAFEQAWSAPITTQEMIDGIHSYGFNTIRIPIAWSSMVNEESGNYEINDKFMNRVEEVVNYALNDGMYVIINIHWDYGWWSEFAQEEWVDKANKRYESYWKQICERFKDYSDHLIFESANEEFNQEINKPLNAYGYKSAKEKDNATEEGTMTDDDIYKLANTLNQKFVNIVRESGGNNEYRHLLLAGFNTNIAKTCDERFVMPTDPTAVDNNNVNKLSVSVHYYTPWDFCGDGMTGSWNATEYDLMLMDHNFSQMKKFVDQGYGVIVGEYGVCNPQQANICEWMSHALDIMRNYKLLPVLWDTPGMYYDRNKCMMRYSDIAELFNMYNGGEGDTSSVYKSGPVEKDISYIPVGDLEGQEPVWKWEGRWYKNDGGNVIGDDRTKEEADDGSMKWVTGTVVEAKEGTDNEPEQPFYVTSSCTNEDQIVFNSWGYWTTIKPDWTTMTNPYIVVTTLNQGEEDAIHINGDFMYGTVEGLGVENSTDRVTIPYDQFEGYACSLPLKDLLYNDSAVSLTFANFPIITGIYVYDIAE